MPGHKKSGCKSPFHLKNVCTFWLPFHLFFLFFTFYHYRHHLLKKFSLFISLNSILFYHTLPKASNSFDWVSIIIWNFLHTCAYILQYSLTLFSLCFHFFWLKNHCNVLILFFWTLPFNVIHVLSKKCDTIQSYTHILICTWRCIYIYIWRFPVC